MKNDIPRCRSAAVGFADEGTTEGGVFVISFHRERCIDCRRCRDACRVGCRHCDEAPCVEACPEGAIGTREDNGVVLLDSSLCTGCRLCLSACPYGVPQFGEDGKMKKCGGCINEIGSGSKLPSCVAVCSTGALMVEWRGTKCSAPAL
jgi:Fe-S-cluster-containing dehydrogenase component